MAINNLIESKNVITILDIGSSKIVCLIAKVINNKLHIIGNGCHSANGFKNGNISDSKLAKGSIIAAVDQAEKAAGVIIDKVILALNGNKIRSHYLQPVMNLKKQKISNNDIHSLILSGIKELEKQGHEVIHYFPLSYNVDGNTGIKDPHNLIATQLSAHLHFVTISSILLENIIHCLAGCQLNVQDCVFAPYAAGLATLHNNDKELGATVIDLGAGITSYALFAQNNMLNCGFIPIGSASITNDIAKSFMLDASTAERIKTIHGAANVHYVDNQKMIHYNSEDRLEVEERRISNAELNEVINARIEEILTLLKGLLDKQYHLFPNAQDNIILTGGGSMLIGIKEEASLILNSKVKLGHPITLPGLSQDAVNATYSAAIGTLQYLSHNQKTENFNKLSFGDKIAQWFQKSF